MLIVPADILEEVLAHAQAETPRECCGLLGGVVFPPGALPSLGRGIVQRRFSLVNEAACPERDFFAERSLFEPFRQMRAHRLRLLAIYHSHPTTAAVPSRADAHQHLYPHALQLIVSPRITPPEVGVWSLTPAGFVPASWQIVDKMPS